MEVFFEYSGEEYVLVFGLVVVGIGCGEVLGECGLFEVGGGDVEDGLVWSVGEVGCFEVWWFCVVGVGGKCVDCVGDGGGSEFLCGVVYDIYF